MTKRTKVCDWLDVKNIWHNGCFKLFGTKSSVEKNCGSVIIVVQRLKTSLHMQNPLWDRRLQTEIKTFLQTLLASGRFAFPRRTLKGLKKWLGHMFLSTGNGIQEDPILGGSLMPTFPTYKFWYGWSLNSQNKRKCTYSTKLIMRFFCCCQQNWLSARPYTSNLTAILCYRRDH